MVSNLWINVIGIAGALGVLSAFLLEDMDRIVRGGVTYNLINLIGSALLLANAILTRNLAFFILNFSWVVISIYYLMKRRRDN